MIIQISFHPSSILGNRGRGRRGTQFEAAYDSKETASNVEHGSLITRGVKVSKIH